MACWRAYLQLANRPCRSPVRYFEVPERSPWRLNSLRIAAAESLCLVRALRASDKLASFGMRCHMIGEVLDLRASQSERSAGLHVQEP